MAMQNAQILFPVNVPNAFDYSVPCDFEIAIGNFVYAPIGKQIKLGVVVSLGKAEQNRKLRELVSVKQAKPLTAEMIQFIFWTSRYNCAPLGLILKMVLGNLKSLDPSPVVNYFSLNKSLPPKLTTARLSLVNNGGPFPARVNEIAKRARISPGVVRGFIKSGGLISEIRQIDKPFDKPIINYGKLDLTEGQQLASEQLVSQVRKKEFNVSLLDGVTGSGKTEVYFEAIAEAIKENGQALILVPEISLTQAAISRFKKRFGVLPATWHSQMTAAAKRRVWREVAHGRAKLVVGARSALYLPFESLRLIVVDEEHDTSYKQEEGVKYNARDMSVVRSKISNHSVILASATPALETLVNARSGKYAHIILPERPGSAFLPKVELVDLKKFPTKKNKFISEPLIVAIEKVLENKEQAMLYLNRRGYAPLILCQSCGEKLKSPDTDSWLVEHRSTNRAVCHLTGFSMPMPKSCLKCGVEESFKSVGPGVERISEEVSILFPNANVEILSSDTSRNAEELASRMLRMEKGEIDIMIGTQMVVKGHNFPNLTFVGVIDGDLSLSGGDLRAGERTFQTLVQVSGRAGRTKKLGHALIQTHQPEHEALAALEIGDRDSFIDAELNLREALLLPPFGKLAAVIISGTDEKKTDVFANKFISVAPKANDLTILGPSEPLMGRIRGRYRRRILVQSRLDFNLSKYMQLWRGKIKTHANIKLQIDIDPQSFM
jgi:primosomal protein N' (replication factor Y)